MDWDMLLVTLSFDFLVLVVIDNGCLATEGVLALDRVRWR